MDTERKPRRKSTAEPLDAATIEKNIAAVENLKRLMGMHYECIVTFIKKTGEKRVMHCNRNFELDAKLAAKTGYVQPKGTGTTTSDDLAKRGILRVFDLEKKEFRTITATRVIDVKIVDSDEDR